MDPSQMLNRNYSLWPPPGLPPPLQSSRGPSFSSSQLGRNNWKGKMHGKCHLFARDIAGGHKQPNFKDLQSQNRQRARRFHHKKKFDNRFAPFAPRNTTSFIIRAKKSGGIASLVSPCPVTPAVLPTPEFSPSSEVLVDMAKEEWGVDGYGSMKGLIRLRSLGQDGDEEEGEGEIGGGSSDSDVEEHVEVERRLDHDLSRFEMVYPSSGDEQSSILLESRFDDQNTRIAQLEEENFTLKERLFMVEKELGDLRRRVQWLENNGEASENESENDGGGAICSANGWVHGDGE